MNPGYKVLVVEDEGSVREVLKEVLEPEYSVLTVENGEEAMEVLERGGVDLLITDLKLPGMDGMEIIKRAKEISHEMAIIVITGYGTIESAIEAMKKGAYDYLTKPFRMDKLLLDVKKALEYKELKKENLHLREEVQKRYSFENIIGDSEAMVEIYQMVKRVADSDSTILLLGETGTGKELIARNIHYNSSRRQFPFVPVNCGAIPAELMESELFGHEKGAFTGAIATRLGRFERANHGTIFLDEIAEMPLHLQVKLLRVLQEKEFERVGGNRTIQVDVRVIAATNRDIEEAVEKKTFRKDLYYRLNVLPIVIPPLRERREDIPLLVSHFLDAMSHKKKRRIKGISREALDILMNYPWPGNIRELENVIERTVILKQDNGPILPEDLPPRVKELKGGEPFPLDIPNEGIKLPQMLEEIERGFIEKAVTRTGGVKSRAAKLLGINRTTLIEKMKKRGIMKQP